MRLRRVALAGCSLVALVWLASSPAAAQSVNRNLIDELNTQLLYVALPLTVFVEVILVYAVVRFSGNDDPKPTIDVPSLELTWTIATAIVLLFVGLSAYVVLTNPYISPGQAAATVDGDDERVQVTGYRYGWQFTYPEANVTTRNELVIPANRSVTLNMTSADTLHALFVPRLGVKKDLFPGEYTRIRTNATRFGEHRAYCTELCGVGHSRMRATVTVVNETAYRTWLADHAGQHSVTEAPPVPE
ncbi:cytochrome c oxidase subunit II [Halorientalis marina]|uniref:cytochrome c oxidase subunit II n=1 Tax=Halorientalis marina TaxID=2931976 RepID=UPI001FF52E9F|nr:cytochrome c oxidase subunit II [Halorientalis marina]